MEVQYNNSSGNYFTVPSLWCSNSSSSGHPSEVQEWGGFYERQQNLQNFGNKLYQK